MSSVSSDQTTGEFFMELLSQLSDANADTACLSLSVTDPATGKAVKVGFDISITALEEVS